jgi:hypothetical protein
MKGEGLFKIFSIESLRIETDNHASKSYHFVSHIVRYHIKILDN